MEWVCDIGVCRWARSEERSDAMRIISDERRRPAANAHVPEGCAGMGRCRVAPHPRTTQTHSITQTGSLAGFPTRTCAALHSVGATLGAKPLGETRLRLCNPESLTS